MQNATANGDTPGCTFFDGKLPKFSLDINSSFVTSLPGAFKIAHTFVGLICLSVIAHSSQLFHPLDGSSLGLICSSSAAFFLLTTYACFVTSLLLLLCSLCSYFTASFLPKTAFETAYHCFACIGYLASSLALMMTLVVDNSEKGWFREPGFGGKMTVSVLGLINSVLYGVSTYFSFQSLRQMA